MGSIAIGAEEKMIEVQLAVPDSAWTLAIETVHQVNRELWVVAALARDPTRMGAQAITTRRATVTITATDLPVKIFVLGKTWTWANRESIRFIADLTTIEKALHSGTSLYRRGADPAGLPPDGQPADPGPHLLSP